MRVLLFDTETDGLIINPESQTQPRIVEIFFLMIEQTGFGSEAKFVELGSWGSLVNPGRRMRDEIIGIHKITNEMVADKPTFQQLAIKVIKSINRAERVVAHNAMFDVEMVNLELARVMVDGPWQPPRWPEIWCTVEQTEHWFQHKLPLGTNSRGKTGLYPLLFKEMFKDAHRGETDVRALAKVYMECERREWNWHEEATDDEGRVGEHEGAGAA
jgi:DNA polymerase III epsilon subunit-like protein